MKETEQPIKARITSAVQQKRENILGEAIMLSFEFEGKTREEDFGSPLLTEENMVLWRRITLSAVLDQRSVKVEDPRVQDFEQYKSAVVQKEVFIAFNGAEVYAVGANPKNMFFPYEYGLWD